MNPAAILTHCVTALLLIACASPNADLYTYTYTYTDEAGVLHLSNSPIDARYRLTLIEPQRAAVVTASAALAQPAAAFTVSMAATAGNPYQS